MEEIFIGELIKKERIKRGITQEQLCEGLCQPITISRLERGIQAPSYKLIIALLQRLGLPDNKFYAVLNENEIKTERYLNKLTSLNIKYKRALTENKVYIKKDIIELLDVLKKAYKADVIIQQNIRRTELLLKKDNVSTEDQISEMFNTIKMTKPGFDIYNINSDIYTYDEVKMINHLAGLYNRNGEKEKVNLIMDSLYQYTGKRTTIVKARAHFVLIAVNYSNFLAEKNDLAEANRIVLEGRKTCIENGFCENLPGLIYVQSKIEKKLGNKDKAEDLCKQAYYLYKSVDDFFMAEKLSKNLKL